MDNRGRGDFDIFFSNSMKSTESNSKKLQFLYFNMISDGTFTFIAIQLAYLFTNHANVSEILKMSCSWSTMKFIFFGVKTEVRPVITTVSSTVDK